MIKIAGIWEFGWNTPIKELDLWEYPLRDFVVDMFYMTPISGIKSDVVHERESMEDILNENRDFDIVFVDERGYIDLENFIHPKNVMYIFGKSGLSSLSAYGNKDSISVKIKTIKNSGLLWPHQAASIILYDRFIKFSNYK